MGQARKNGDTQLATLNLNFENLATIVNGEEDNPIDMRPFEKFFTKVTILLSWFKIGLVPFNWECLWNKKHTLGRRN